MTDARPDSNRKQLRRASRHTTSWPVADMTPRLGRLSTRQQSYVPLSVSVRSVLASLRSSGHTPPLWAFLPTLALPAVVRGPLEPSHREACAPRGTRRQ